MTLDKVYDVAETFEKASLQEWIVHGKRLQDSAFTEENQPQIDRMMVKMICTLYKNKLFEKGLRD